MTAAQVETDETDRLIASNKVEGTVAHNRQGEHLGAIHNFMVGKRSGNAEHAVLSSGGLFGMGGDHIRCRGRC